MTFITCLHLAFVLRVQLILFIFSTIRYLIYIYEFLPLPYDDQPC